MSAFWQKVDERLPFTKTERIIIAFVLLLHALPALEFLHWSSKPTRVDDERVMANLINLNTATTQQSASDKVPSKTPKDTQKINSTEQEISTRKKNLYESNSQSTVQTNEEISKESSNQSNPNNSGRTQIIYSQLTELWRPEADAFYPSFSKRSGESGVVKIKMDIDENGKVENVEIEKSSGYPRLDRAALQIAALIRFKPYLINGSPSKISTSYGVNFNLKN